MASEKNTVRSSQPPGVFSTLVFAGITVALTFFVADVLLCIFLMSEAAWHGYWHAFERLQYMVEQTASVVTANTAVEQVNLLSGSYLFQNAAAAGISINSRLN